MTYRAPLDDLLFGLAQLGGESPDPDTASAVLGGFARFCEEEIAPLNAPGDRAGARCDAGHVTTAPGFREAYARFVAMGWPGLGHPEAWGGQGMPRTVAAAAGEIVNAACMSFALCPLLTDGAVEALRRFGSPEVQSTYLPRLVAGEWTGTMNLTEPQAGSDLSLLRTRAEPAGDGSWRVTGTKIFITWGEHDMAPNIVHLVHARTPGSPEGLRGISLFLVPRIEVGADGAPGARNAVRCVSIEHKLGVRASPTCVLQFEGAKGVLVGREGAGVEQMFAMMNAARFAVGVQGVAIADRALQQAEGYARDRVQGRAVGSTDPVPVAIADHPDVRRLLARMRAATEGCRALALFAAAWADRADAGEDGAAAMAEFLVPVVKGYATECAVETASTGVQVHGGMGFIEETGAAQHLRDARILPIYEGTTAIQANDLLGRKTLRDGGATAHRLADLVAETERALATGPLGDLADRLGSARADFLAAVAHLGQAPARAAHAEAVPYLMLAGTLVAGWQLARHAQAAAAAPSAPSAPSATTADPAFLARKIATARFFAHHLLPGTAVELARVRAGDLADVA